MKQLSSRFSPTSSSFEACVIEIKPNQVQPGLIDLSSGRVEKATQSGIRIFDHRRRANDRRQRLLDKLIDTPVFCLS